MSYQPSAIGLWLNDTHLEGALVTADGQLFAYEKMPLIADVLIERIVSLTQHLLDMAPSYQLDALGVGVGVLGTVQNNRLVQSSNFLKPLVDFPLLETLSQNISLPIVISKDTHFMAIAESLLGGGQNYSEMVYLTIGNDVSGAILHKGELWQGSHSSAGEIGTIVADWLGEKPITLTQKASSHGIIAEYGMRSRKFTKPTIHEIIDFSRHNDQLAMRVLRDGGRVFGSVVSPFVGLIDPQVVIVSGELAHGSELWWDRFEMAFRQTALPNLRDVPLLRAHIAHNSTLLGASLVTLNHIQV